MTDPKDARILYVTCCRNGLFTLDRLRQAGYRNLRVVTIPPEVAARANVAGYVDMRDPCDAHGIPLHTLQDYRFEASDIDHVRSFAPDLFIVNGWNRLIPEAVYGAARRGAYGVHAGHPPKGRGRAPIAWTLLRGLKDLEVYIFQLTPDADDGPLVATRRVEVTPHDTAATLYDKVSLAAARLFTSTLPGLLRGSVQARPQDRTGATYNPKRGPMDGRIDWQEPVERVHDFVRAQSDPYPGAFTEHAGRRLWIWRAQPFDRYDNPDQARPPGTVLESLDAGVVVQTGTTPLLVTELQWDGEARTVRFDFTKPAVPAGSMLGRARSG